jgi:hypothetical protein
VIHPVKLMFEKMADGAERGKKTHRVLMMWNQLG